MSIIKGDFVATCAAIKKCLQRLILIVQYVDITATSRILLWVGESKKRNVHKPFAVALKKAGTGTVGHIPRTTSCICTLFLRQGDTIESNVTWIKDIILTTADKQLLIQGEKFSDKYINAAQRKLKMMFPKIKLTLLQDKTSHTKSTENALQIFHSEGNHWVCATTIGASGKKVIVYDSAYTRWSDKAVSFVRKQF